MPNMMMRNMPPMKPTATSCQATRPANPKVPGNRPLGNEFSTLGTVVEIAVHGVEQAVDDRREQHTGGHDEDQSGIQGVQAGEDFSAGAEIGLDRAHAAKQHGRVEKGLSQSQAFKVLVAPNATSE